MMFMLLNFFMDSEDLYSDSSSSTQINSTCLSLFINLETRIFSISRGGSLLLDVNTKGYEVAEHIATKSEVNTRIFSSLKKKNPSEV